MSSTALSPQDSGDITAALAAAPPPPQAFSGGNPALQEECDAFQPRDTEKALQQYRESLRLHMARMAQGLVARDLTTSTQSTTDEEQPPLATHVKDPGMKPQLVERDSDPLSGAAAPRP